ncbi:WecB/TagA/CpsF family glycosyltransferase [Candidatus Haliotispira prima]|uniref:WecB/TagA/CpsF family glycosyltransferase n=1 Tax=Candidatus Haliotispira prima TaxID=3034016 RepID=A0ABY8MIR1_9SPIO|nr:WecB/TagA/CpsF family glycosyltransferase [Candidatus Haliotispira prima]
MRDRAVEPSHQPNIPGHTRVLYLKVNLGHFSDFVATICHWAEDTRELAGNREGRYVCIAPVTVCMESFWNEDFRRICQEADLVTPDGKPIVWALRKLGHREQEQVAGPDLMSALCREAAQREIPIGLYGGTERGLALLQQNLERQFPGLNIVYAYPPPWRAVGAAAPEEELEAIRRSEAKILFVGIGCPKQETWMARHKDSLPLVMLGVGAAFLFHSGELRRAPQWMRHCGLEWLFRLLQEPKRLFRRYFRTNLAYLWHSRCLSGKQLRKYL